MVLLGGDLFERILSKRFYTENEVGSSYSSRSFGRYYFCFPTGTDCYDSTPQRHRIFTQQSSSAQVAYTFECNLLQYFEN